MAYKQLLLTSLVVNPANDRHGELENETAAIAQLFASQELQMRNLAKDLVSKGEVFEPPLVFPDGDKFIVADGNRRTTCLKLLSASRRAPTVELQQFFADLRKQWKGRFPEKIECRVESDRDRVDDILFRRHTGVQGGVGQSTWNDRMKNNFIVRTGKSGGLHLADEVEKLLVAAKMLPDQKIPRSNMNRLLSAESLRNRLGISVRKGKLEVIGREQATLSALQRVATDLATRTVTLENIWSAESKLRYIDRLEKEGILPKFQRDPESLVSSSSAVLPSSAVKILQATSSTPIRQKVWSHLIPEVEYGVIWTAPLQRHREIWEELQFELELTRHPNAVSVLLRVLIELSIDYYIETTSPSAVHENDKLARKAVKVAEDMHKKGQIDAKYLGAINKLQQGDAILSMDTLNRYVHSPNFRVSPEHLRMLWGTLSPLVVKCLSA